MNAVNTNCTLLKLQIGARQSLSEGSSSNMLREKGIFTPSSRAPSHDAPLSANKRGQPIEVTRLKLAAPPPPPPRSCFPVWKAAHALAGRLAGRRNDRGKHLLDTKQHKWMWWQAGRGEQNNSLPFVLFVWRGLCRGEGRKKKRG